MAWTRKTPPPRPVPAFREEVVACSHDEAHVLVDIRPGEGFELMIQNLYGLANDGKTNARGVPKLLPLALFAREFRDEAELIRPPRIVQGVLFALLVPIARARGYKGISQEYLGPTGRAAALRR